MTPVNNDSWTDRLSEYLDDELTAAERRDIEAHIAGCPACAATLEDLRRVVDRARTSVPPAPPSDLWDGIAARIATHRSSARQPWRVSFTMPQLAAASILLVLLSGALAWRLRAAIPSVAPASTPVATVAPEPASQPLAERPRVEPVGLADAQYDLAVADLQRALNAGRGHLDPATVKVVQQNLDIIDRALDQARQALVDDPNNGYLTRHLVDTRRRKLDLLRRAAAMATDSD